MPRLVSFKGLNKFKIFNEHPHPFHMGVPPPRACMPPCQGERGTVQVISIIMWKIPFHQSHYHPWRMKKLESHLLQLEEIHDEAGELNKKNINITDSHSAITTKDKLFINFQTINRESTLQFQIFYF